jgi:hypothetical protein
MALAMQPVPAAFARVTRNVTLRIGPRQRFRNYAPVPAVPVAIATMAPGTQTSAVNTGLSSPFSMNKGATRFALRISTQTGSS